MYARHPAPNLIEPHVLQKLNGTRGLLSNLIKKRLVFPLGSRRLTPDETPRIRVHEYRTVPHPTP